MSKSNAALIKAARDRFVADFEGREPLHIGVVDGVCWVTVLAPTVGINGYAMVPAEGHPWSNGWPVEDAWDLDNVLEVHGGVTWINHPWVGFDTAHAWDWWPPEYDKLGMASRFLMVEGAKRWTPALVAYEARRLAIQVAKIGFQARAQASVTLAEAGSSRFQNLDIAERNTTEGKQ